jgi:CysZ protein
LQKQAGMLSYPAMIKAAFKALGDLLSPEFRSIFWRAIGLTLLMFVAVFAAVQAAFYFLTFFPYPWVETIAAIGAGLGLLVAFFFLMAPVTAVFAGLYLDDIAAKVEARHYASHAPGKALSVFKAMAISVQFGLLVLGVNLLALPLVFTGFGAIVLVVINAYLLSREYFEMAAMRFMSPGDAKDLRASNAVPVFIAGLLPAVMSLVPILNLTVPLFSTSYFVHLFKQVKQTSA